MCKKMIFIIVPADGNIVAEKRCLSIQGVFSWINPRLLSKNNTNTV